MDIIAIFNSDIYTFAVIPLLIFLARIVDVSFGTMRVIFISKGFRYLAPFLGFFEVLVWLGAMRQIMVNLSSVACYIAYAAGFAAGTYAGIVIEQKLSIGNVIIRIITNNDSSRLLKKLQEEGHIVTSSGAKSPDGKVKILYAVLRRQDISKAIKTVKEFNPNAFYSIEDVRFVSENNHHVVHKPDRSSSMFGFYRKGK
jgi:uncharacterized protein YebE (UPF0316 family)